MRNLRIPTARVFAPLLEPARYKGAYGGRGSAKSHFFAGAVVEYAAMHKGSRILCFREVQKSLKQSAKKLIEDKLTAFGFTERDGFKVFKAVIETPGGGLIDFIGLQDHTADSVKSYEGVNVAWGEEASSISDYSMSLLRPTIRADNSELWFSWNPMRPTDPVDRMLRSEVRPTDAVIVRSNWSDNPWFPATMEQERQDCLRMTPERYSHTWEGEYATVLDGAYYAQHLTRAQLEGRIGILHRDPLLPVHAFWDIGGTSGKSDATAIWIVQVVGEQIRVLDYYEAQGQPFDAHVRWLQAKGYGDAVCVLPHDGAKHDTVFAITPQGYLSKAGFTVETVANQGRGAALQRIDAARQMFPAVWFQDEATKPGREALGWYHAKKDEARGHDLGPEHDWSSHGADAFGMLAVWHAARPAPGSWGKPIRRNLGSVF